MLNGKLCPNHYRSKHTTHFNLISLFFMRNYKQRGIRQKQHFFGPNCFKFINILRLIFQLQNQLFFCFGASSRTINPYQSEPTKINQTQFESTIFKGYRVKQTHINSNRLSMDVYQLYSSQNDSKLIEMSCNHNCFLDHQSLNHFHYALYRFAPIDYKQTRPNKLVLSSNRLN